MGFYNGLANSKKSFLQFDHVYPNRTEMEKALTADPSEVSVGGYALVQYWNENRNLIPAFQFDSASSYLSADQNGDHLFLVAKEDVESVSASEETPANEETSTDENETESQETEDTETNPTDKDNEKLAEDEKAYIINKNSYFIVTNRAGEEVGYFSCIQNGYENKDTYKATNYYKARFKQESSAADREGTEKDNYLWNYKVDRKQYAGAGRGWNGTVWQKVASDKGAKYQFIADLNSATPTFDVTYDAPSETPIVPHFDADISNIYYKIHMQPQWGVRIREASPILESGEAKYTTEKTIYPSDITGDFVTSSQLVRKNETTEDGETKEYPEVEKEINKNVSLAVYFNKNGFDKRKSSNAIDDAEEAKGATKGIIGTKENLSNYIEFIPSGKSGNKYYNSKDPVEPIKAVDTYELSIMLPSIGQTISDVWDIVYGGNVKKDDEGNIIDNSRNTSIEWDDYTGARALPTSRSASLTYKPEALNTIAGNINTFHDITGMIIREFSQENFNPSEYDVSNWDSTKIYYNNKNNKFYIKAKTYSYAAGSDYWERPNIKVSNNEEITTRYLDVVPITNVFKEDLKQHPTKGWYYDYLKLTNEKDYVDGAVYVQITSLPSGYYQKNNNYLKDLSIEDEQGGYSRPDLTQVEVWRPNTFYTKNGDNYVLSTSYNQAATYYKKVGPYVYSDSNNKFAQGTEWTYEKVSDGVTLGTRTEKWVAKELTGFTNDNNILGFLVKLNQLLNNDELIRDTSTVPGIQRKVEDILKQFRDDADDTVGHFWFTNQGSDPGAHITYEKQSDSFSGNNIVVNEDGVEIRNKNNNTYAKFGYNVESHIDHFTGDGESTQFSLSEVIISENSHYLPEIKINNELISSNDYSVSSTDSFSTLIFNSAPAEGAEIECIYYISVERNAFTIGSRASNIIGDYSYAQGTEVDAEGQNSHAEGKYTYAVGSESHAQNLGTVAYGQAQTAIGKYNIDDYKNQYALIIGNGKSSRKCSNALTVDWDGNVSTDGIINAGAFNATYKDFNITTNTTDDTAPKWELPETAVDATRTFYVYTITLGTNDKILATIPEVSLLATQDTTTTPVTTRILPTEDEEMAFNSVSYITVNVNDKTLKLYAESVPETGFTIRVIGVKGGSN